MKSPEQYFEESAFQAEDAAGGEFTVAELAFLRKYLGVAGEKDPKGNVGEPIEPESVSLGGKKPAAPWIEAAADAPRPSRTEMSQGRGASPRAESPERPASASPASSRSEEAPRLQQAPQADRSEAAAGMRTVRPEVIQPPVASVEEPISQPVAADPVRASRPHAEPPALKAEAGEIEDLEAQLKSDDNIQLVSFFLGKQEFALPISVIQEVIRYVPPTKLPAAPPFLAGMINLRGRVTPLVRLRTLLSGRSHDGEEDRFIIVCRRKGLQLGLIIQAVATMYRPTQKELEWNIEAQVGVSANYLLGLMKADERLISVVSIDRLVDRVLKS